MNTGSEKTGAKAPVAWRWTNQFGKEVLTSNEKLANAMVNKFLVESLCLGGILADPIKSHPAYHEGFFDMLNGAPAPGDECPPEYLAGWNAARKSKAVLEKAGFEQRATDFRLSGALRNGDSDLG